MSGVLDAHCRRQLQVIRDAGLARRRRVIDGPHGVVIRADGRRCINFCSNDYLGLAADRRLAEAAARALSECGTGSGAAALVSGCNRHHVALEQELAEFVGRPRALLFSNGWAANLGVLRALLDRGSVLVADELNHASLIDGGRLSGARYLRAGHADPAVFAAQLDAALALADGQPGRGLPVLAVTDAVFSMDGDVAPLRELLALCRRRGVPLMVDDAHGFGVLGPQGRGTPAALGLDAHGPEVLVATLGKALGCAGAFVAGSEDLVELLVNRARTFVFSTAMPPVIAAAARAALGILRKEHERLARLHANIAHLRRGAAERGIRLGPPGSDGPPLPPTPIHALVIGDARRTMALSEALLARGFWVAGIRPPTVPQGTSRLRITVSAAHEPAQIDALLDAIAELAACPEAAAC